MSDDPLAGFLAAAKKEFLEHERLAPDKARIVVFQGKTDYPLLFTRKGGILRITHALKSDLPIAEITNIAYSLSKELEIGKVAVLGFDVVYVADINAMALGPAMALQILGQLKRSVKLATDRVTSLSMKR